MEPSLPIWNKLDTELALIYTDYLAMQTGANPEPENRCLVMQTGHTLTVLLTFSGALATIEALGFNTIKHVAKGMVFGGVHLGCLARLATHPAVQQLSFGSPPQPMLNTSVRAIDARGYRTGDNTVWMIDRATGALVGFTGKGVVIGIIDSGIDYLHHDFLEVYDPAQPQNNKTRIKRIWDMGLVPQSGESAPEASLLSNNHSNTYGVEYTEDHINATVRGVPTTAIRHEDAIGHGTAVASVAAGRGFGHASEEANKYAGVAPEAYLVVVKLSNLANTPKANNQADGARIGFFHMVADAIDYINNVASTHLDDKPVVTNMSLGYRPGPGDGLTEGEQMIQEKYAGTSRKLFVTSAGNWASNNGYGVLTIAAGSTAILTLKAYNTSTVKPKETGFDLSLDADDLVFNAWYNGANTGVEVAILEEIDDDGDGTAPDLIFSEPLGATTDSVEASIREHNLYEAKLTHTIKNTTRPVSGGAALPVVRNNIKLTVKNIARTGGESSIDETTFTLRIFSDEAVQMHVWFNNTATSGLTVSNIAQGTFTLKNESQATHLIGAFGGAANVVTVANYNDANGRVGQKSSRGPLADYSGQGPHTTKPDVAAPGVGIMAARIRKVNLLGSDYPWYFYKEYSGTSFSAPHVAGVAALMLQANPDLTTKQLIDLIKNNTDAASPAKVFGAGKVNARKAVAAAKNLRNP